MYEWLLKKDNYFPLRDRDFYINKNLLSLISKVSRIKNQKMNGSLFFYKLHPLIKFIVTIGLVVTVFITSDFYLIILMFVSALFTLSFIDVPEIKKILLICFITAVFSSIILLPSILFLGNLVNGLSLIIKVVSTVMFFNIFSYTTKNQDITRTVKIIGIPDLLILTMDISIKFITIIGDVAINIFNSLKIRSIGINKYKTRSMQNIIGFLFIKSKRYSEDLYSSMICRGFSGYYVLRRNKKNITMADYLYIIANAFLITGVFIWKH